MARGNQREKAREKNLKAQQTEVRRCSLSPVSLGLIWIAMSGPSKHLLMTGPITEKEELHVRHRISTPQGRRRGHHAREAGKRFVAINHLAC